MPLSHHPCGSRRQPLELAGIHNQVEATRVLDAFRDDVDWLAGMATPEQRAIIGDAPAHPDLRARGTAVWTDTDEGRAALRQERDRQRKEYEAAWGRVPEW